MVIEELIEKAREAQKLAYAPYSNFPVGAALITEDGTVFTGCNIESAAYGATNCAERVAIQKAVSEGYHSFTHLAVVGREDYTYPCGICRQVIMEFAPKSKIIVSGKDDYVLHNAEDLLPYAFTGKDLL
ncbi:MAG: cytidine deaminase [Tissierellia bacterium]|nr:cytidine deaminase [Tissierellia bacterium]